MTSRVNLILFEQSETGQLLPRSDPRAVHLLDVLHRSVGDTFDAGLVNGARGKGVITAIEEATLKFSFTWGATPPVLDPITLLVGLPRPQTARKILQEATALGVAQLHFALTDKGEPNYSSSVLWRSGEWRRHLILGAEQAFCTHLPELTHGKPLAELLAALPEKGTRIALDNYESAISLAELPAISHPIILAVGSERGWSSGERTALRTQGFLFAHLGRRVLRVETACTAALAVLKTQAGLWR
jgi:16S rRNA (uracil1498-N3)-methyltransferase